MITIDGKEYYGIIYKIENTITHYIYIGQTTHKRGFNGRYNFKGNGIERVYKYLLNSKKCRQRYNKHLLRSIEKCGLEAFCVDEIIDTALTIDELNEKEAYYIKKYDSYRHGYNMSYGGDGFTGSERPKGKDCPNSKKVCQLGMDGKLIKVWDSQCEAANALGINYSCISSVCSGKRLTAGNYIWVLEKEYDENKNYKYPPMINGKFGRSKPIVLLSDDNTIIEEYTSGLEASEKLHISNKIVSQICLHSRKNKPFNLKFKDEYLEEQRLNVETSA